MNECPPSRSQLKRESLALQDLAERLSGLPPEEIRVLDLPAEIIEALLEAEAMKKRSGFRRHIRYIGGLLRRIDASHISEALERREDMNRRRTAFFQQAEQWRDRLLGEDESVLAEILGAFPAADVQRLRQLARNARREIARVKTILNERARTAAAAAGETA